MCAYESLLAGGGRGGGASAIHTVPMERAPTRIASVDATSPASGRGEADVRIASQTYRALIQQTPRLRSLHRLELMNLLGPQFAVDRRHAAVFVHQRQAIDLEQILRR